MNYYFINQIIMSPQQVLKFQIILLVDMVYQRIIRVDEDNRRQKIFKSFAQKIIF